MTTLIKGLVWFYGPYSTGKTTTALMACDNPNNIGMVDCDSAKGEAIAEQLGIRSYVNMSVLGKGLGILDYHSLFVEQIQALPDDLELIIVDNPKRMFISAHSYVIRNTKDFRTSKDYAPKGQIKVAQQWQDVKVMHLPDVYTTLRSKAPLVIFLTHEKKQMKNDVFTGKMEADADESLMTAAGFVVRLMHNTRRASREPVGLVIKHPEGKIDLKSKTVLNVFPGRIEPFNWPTIKKYIKEPFESREPEGHEIPDDDEVSIIDGTLNEQELAVYNFNRAILTLKIEEAMAADVLSLASELTVGNDIIKSNKIVAELKKDYPQIDMNGVMAILEAAKEE
jgi:hypothetical protein